MRNAATKHSAAHATIIVTAFNVIAPLHTTQADIITIDAKNILEQTIHAKYAIEFTIRSQADSSGNSTIPSAILSQEWPSIAVLSGRKRPTGSS